MENKRVAAALFFLVIALTACAAGVVEREERAPLEFVVELAEDGPQLAIILGLRKTGSLSDDSLHAYWELSNGEGELRAESMNPAVEANALPDDGTVLELMTWRGELDPGHYTLIWGVDGIGSTTVEFEIVENNGALLLGRVSYH